ncbi:MAG: NfeD family protein [Planctomycetota bacterium]
MGMEWWLLSMLCLLGLVLLFLEVFIPSGGILAIAAVLCIGYSIWELWIQGEIALSILCAVLTAAYIVGLFKFWIKRIGMSESLGDTDALGDDVRTARELIGQRGLVTSDLRPAGIALIAGRRLDVVANQGFIEKGDSVVVVQSDGNRIMVRKSTEESQEE